MDDLKAGTVVQLKSGGPKMTCTGETDSMGRIHTRWFAGSKAERGYFEPEMLIVIPEQEKEEK